MAEKLARIFEYRVLLAKAESVGLSAAEHGRLERLATQLPALVPPLDERDPYTLLAEPLAAELLDRDRFAPALVRNAGALGLALSVSEPPPLGRSLAVRVRDARHPIEYTFPARVVSRVVSGLRGISVAFEGMPLQGPLVGRSSGVWRANTGRSRRHA
jgi:hypothetical protein